MESRGAAELLYKDRLVGRIPEELFDKMNSQLTKHMDALENERENLRCERTQPADVSALVKIITDRLEKRELTYEMASAALRSVIVNNDSVTIDLRYKIT